jgi:serine/threonine protein phosphatase PrpC
MNEYIKNENMTIILESAEKQLCSQQDITAILTIDEEEGHTQEYGDQPIDIIAVWDGHGPNLVTDIIKEQNLEKVFTSSDPAEYLQSIIDHEVNKKKEEANNIKYRQNRNKITNKVIYKSGATFSFAKIYRNTYTNKIKIVAEWLGDSPILIFVNNKLIFQSEIHDPLNNSEIKRLQDKGILYEVKKSIYGFVVTSEDTIEENPGTYIIFNHIPDVSFAMTRSLGHNRITDVETQKKVIECNIDDEIKIIIFSDGVGDMLNMDIDIEKLKIYSAEEIVEFAENRWKQLWLFKNKQITFPCYGVDDCCCAIWSQKKI